MGGVFLCDTECFIVRPNIMGSANEVFIAALLVTCLRVLYLPVLSDR